MTDSLVTPEISEIPPEVWSSPDYVSKQIELIQEGLTQVLFGDYSVVVRTEGGDPIWGNLAMHINVVINAVRNAIARAEKSEALAAMRLTLEDKNRELEGALEALQDQNQQIREAHRLLRQMFANVSHEFRTPLTLCLTPLEAVLNGEAGELTPRQEYLVGVAQSNATKLLGMITSLLDLARLDADAVSVRPQRLNLEMWLSDLVDLFSPTATSRGVTLAVRVDAPSEAVVDPLMLEKVVANLVSNALKFTPSGGKVTVRAAASRRGLYVRVRDTGIGMEPEALSKIFERFRQVDGTLARRYEGTGIGLALVKEFCDRMGGTVRVWSRAGKGTLFRVFLPHGEVDEAVAPSTPSRRQRATELGITVGPTAPAGSDVRAADDAARGRRKMLVVEDNEEIGSLLCSLLASEYEPVWVRNGREALERVRKVEPEVILSDVMIPEMDGLTLCHRIKEQPDLAPIPFVLLTAQGDREMVLKGWEAGADDYLVKPFHVHELRVRLRSLVRLRASHRALASRTTELEESNQKLVASQAQLVQSGKMAAVGQLAAGVAHELNNPLTTILGFGTSLRRRVSDESQGLAVDSILREARRARDLVQDLLTFSRSSTGQQVRLQPRALLERVRSLCEHRARLQKIDLTVDTSREIPDVSGDPRRLEQVLVNFVNNAMDMLEAGGRVTVDVAVADDQVLLQVTDSGPGVPEEIRAKIFEPFFTTKPAGKGTGLGLALCLDIARAHDGVILVDNVSDGGARFTLRLPALAAAGQGTV
jgi:signal transduction histidine kinase